MGRASRLSGTRPLSLQPIMLYLVTFLSVTYRNLDRLNSILFLYALNWGCVIRTRRALLFDLLRGIFPLIIAFTRASATHSTDSVFLFG